MIPAVPAPFGRRLPPWDSAAPLPVQTTDGRTGLLRPWNDDDALPLWAAWPREWVRMAPVFPWWGRLPVIPADTLASWIQRQRDQTAQGHAWWLALSTPPPPPRFGEAARSGRLLGGVSVEPVPHWGLGRPRAARLGCWILADAEGQGWMRAAFATLIWHLWQTTSVRRIEWRTPDSNTRAHALNRRLGGLPTRRTVRLLDAPDVIQRCWRLDYPSDPVHWAQAQGLRPSPPAPRHGSDASGDATSRTIRE